MEPTQITTGPDGALWFTELFGNAIGRITTSGVVTTYPVPTLNSSPSWITLGPDGALWFTEFNVSKIGRITTSGVITEFPVPANTGPSGITTGPDGALWFTNVLINRIGRMTTAGGVTEYPYFTRLQYPPDHSGSRRRVVVYGIYHFLNRTDHHCRRDHGVSDSHQKFSN